MANFIYTLTLSSGSNKLEGIPVFGFCPGGLDPSQPSWQAQSKEQVRMIVQAVDRPDEAPGRPQGMTVAVPFPEVSKYFKPKTQYDRLTMFPNDNFLDQFNVTGNNYTFDNIVVGANRIMAVGAFKFYGKEAQWLSDFCTKNNLNPAGIYRPCAVDLTFTQPQ